MTHKEHMRDDCQSPPEDTPVEACEEVFFLSSIFLPPFSLVRDMSFSFSLSLHAPGSSTWFLVLGASPKRPAARQSPVDAIIIKFVSEPINPARGTTAVRPRLRVLVPAVLLDAAVLVVVGQLLLLIVIFGRAIIAMLLSRVRIADIPKPYRTDQKSQLSQELPLHRIPFHEFLYGLNLGIVSMLTQIIHAVCAWVASHRLLCVLS